MLALKFFLIWFVFLEKSISVEQPTCPDGTALVDYTSQFSGLRQVYCSKQTDRGFVKHGPELVYDNNGKIKEKNNYQLGVKDKVSLDHSLKLNKKKPSNNNKINIALKKLVQGLMPLGSSSEKGFNVETCKKIKKREIINYLLKKTPIRKRFVFEKNCDIEGSWEINAAPVRNNLNLKNLGPYHSTELEFSVLISLQLSERAAKLTFVYERSLLISSKEVVEFDGRYSVLIGMNGKIREDLGGTLELKKINGNPINKTLCFSMSKDRGKPPHECDRS